MEGEAGMAKVVCEMSSRKNKFMNESMRKGCTHWINKTGRKRTLALYLCLSIFYDNF